MCKRKPEKSFNSFTSGTEPSNGNGLSGERFIGKSFTRERNLSQQPPTLTLLSQQRHNDVGPYFSPTWIKSF